MHNMLQNNVPQDYKTSTPSPMQQVGIKNPDKSNNYIAQTLVMSISLMFCDAFFVVVILLNVVI